MCYLQGRRNHLKPSLKVPHDDQILVSTNETYVYLYIYVYIYVYIHVNMHIYVHM